MTQQELQNIINNGEGERLEFKSNFSKAVIETLVAFSNTRGGQLLIGVDNNGIIKGVDITEETIQKWINEIKQNTEPAVFPIIELVSTHGKKVVIFKVSEFPVKPVAYKDRYYGRKLNSNHKLNVDEISELRFVSLSYSFDAFEIDTAFGELNEKALSIFRDKVNKSGRYKLSNDLMKDFKRL